jgi:diketogulonate reductase-like aldo/keto reductase
MMQRRSLVVAPVLALATGAAAGVAAIPPSAPGWTRPMPRSGEHWPVVGLGTWITFNIGDDAAARAARREVLRRLVAAGGGVIDSSPMYGRAEQVLGELLPPPARPSGAASPSADGIYAATKVWTPLARVGVQQVADSQRLWGRPSDLQQVHNLLNWREHLAMLRDARSSGRVRHIGVSTSHGARHDEMRRVLDSEPGLDVLQITYNPVDERADALMRRAADGGLAVLVNRPFDGGNLLRRLADKPLPAAARDLGATTWAAAVLLWEVSHPAVTAAIPGTGNPDHLDQNLAVRRLSPPGEAQRTRLLRAIRDALDGR